MFKKIFVQFHFTLFYNKLFYSITNYFISYYFIINYFIHNNDLLYSTFMIYGRKKSSLYKNFYFPFWRFHVSLLPTSVSVNSQFFHEHYDRK